MGLDQRDEMGLKRLGRFGATRKRKNGFSQYVVFEMVLFGDMERDKCEG